ncbi:MAG: CidA/LrgA family protein [Geitlerinemataceae cyanobacterium]
MNFLNGITVLLLYELAGEVTTAFLQLPVPGPVMGMTFLFLTLLLRHKTPTSVGTASSALLGHFSLLFVPAGVGLIDHLDRVANEWLPIGLTLMLSSTIAMVFTAATMSATTALLSKRSAKNV